MLRKAVVAAMVGSACGALAGYWSQPAATDFQPPAVPAAMAIGPVGLPAPASVPPPPPVKPQARTEPAPRRADQPRDAVERARLLAQRPDVRAVVALREEVLRRAEDAGEKESPATKRQLDEIDRYLAEARALRLKLDAAEFRKGAADPIPPK